MSVEYAIPAPDDLTIQSDQPPTRRVRRSAKFATASAATGVLSVAAGNMLSQAEDMAWMGNQLMMAGQGFFAASGLSATGYLLGVGRRRAERRRQAERAPYPVVSEGLITNTIVNRLSVELNKVDRHVDRPPRGEADPRVLCRGYDIRAVRAEMRQRLIQTNDPFYPLQHLTDTWSRILRHPEHERALHEERIIGRCALLDEVCPIDQERDTVTQPHPDTGVKYWETFVRQRAAT